MKKVIVSVIILVGLSFLYIGCSGLDSTSSSSTSELTGACTNNYGLVGQSCYDSVRSACTDNPPNVVSWIAGQTCSSLGF